MNVLANMFGALAGARNFLYDRRILRASRLQGPVISVGNLSVGGSGKTPLVILLGELLQARGITFDVLSRGYGRQTRGVAIVDPCGSARDFGDEPLLIARYARVPVVVGESRYQAGLRAEREYGPRVHLLDDGFQHRRLARDFEIVMVSSEDLQDRLLPAGRLREPVSSLRRADAIVIPDEDETGQMLPEGKLVWRVRRTLVLPSLPRSPIVFCGIARPTRFVSQLREQGVEPAAERFFHDHHAYTDQDVQALLSLRSANGGEGFVTTEKDAVNLGARAGALEPLTVVPARTELRDAANAVDTMLRMIAGRRREA